MQLDTKLFTGKPSLEEGPMKHQQPETIIVNRTAPSTHWQRCVQILKIILYLELTLLVGWLGCLLMSHYYMDPKFNSVGIPHENTDWTEMDNSADAVSSEFITTEIPGANIETWRDAVNAEDFAQESTGEIQATTEEFVDNRRDVSLESKSVATHNLDDTDNSDVDMSLMNWLGTIAMPEITRNNGLDSKFDFSDFSKSAELQEVSKIANDDYDRDNLHRIARQFGENWEEGETDSDELNGQIEMLQDVLRALPLFIDAQSKLNSVQEESDNEESKDMMAVSLFQLPFLQTLLTESAERKWGDSDESDASAVSIDLADVLFGFQGHQSAEWTPSRFVRDIGADNGSKSKSSSEETATAASKTKRSAESSSNESDESDDKPESAEISKKNTVAKIFTTIPADCPKILDKNGNAIEDTKGIIDHIRKNWLRSLLETPIPHCGGSHVPKTISLNKCGKFIITCARPVIENETSGQSGVEVNEIEAR